jgi:hypothetical protein
MHTARTKGSRSVSDIPTTGEWRSSTWPDVTRAAMSAKWPCTLRGSRSCSSRSQVSGDWRWASASVLVTIGLLRVTKEDMNSSILCVCVCVCVCVARARHNLGVNGCADVYERCLSLSFLKLAWSWNTAAQYPSPIPLRTMKEAVRSLSRVLFRVSSYQTNIAALAGWNFVEAAVFSFSSIPRELYIRHFVYVSVAVSETQHYKISPCNTVLYIRHCVYVSVAVNETQHYKSSPCSRLWKPLRLWDVEAPTFSKRFSEASSLPKWNTILATNLAHES